MSHNQNILEDERRDTKPYICREKCVVDGKCLLQYVIYIAAEKITEDTKRYVKSSGLTFKISYIRHICSFINYKYKLNDT